MPLTGYLSQLKRAGQAYPYFLSTGTHPARTPSHSDLQGRRGPFKWGAQRGKYKEHKNSRDCDEHPVSTNAMKCFISIAASAWVLWPKVFGKLVMLYACFPPIPRQISNEMTSHLGVLALLVSIASSVVDEYPSKRRPRNVHWRSAMTTGLISGLEHTKAR